MPKRKQPVGSQASAESPSTETVQELRWLRLLQTVMDFSGGTLWWVDESIWRDVLENYDQKSQRDGHPGLCIRTVPVVDLYSQIPMLHGRSKGSGVEVTGLTVEEPKRTTRFNLLGPVPVMETIPRAGKQKVRPNRDKPRLTDAEQQALTDFLQRRRLIP